MKKITAVLVFMCAVSAYMAYPSAEERRQSMLDTLSPAAITMAARALPTEAYDAI
jgi:cytochrome c556